MNYPQSIDELVGVIMHKPVPIVMVDTCGILDVLRFSQRGFLNSRNITVASNLVKNSALYLVTAEKVFVEWKKHVDTEELNTSKELRNIDKQQKALYSAIQDLPNAEVERYPADEAVTLGHLKIEKKLRYLSQEIITKSLQLLVDDDIKLKAYYRISNNLAPSRKGGGQSDCEIVESYIALASKLRAEGFDEKIHFVTSNKNDFCIGNDLHPDLVDEFRREQIEFLLDFSSLNI